MRKLIIALVAVVCCSEFGSLANAQVVVYHPVVPQYAAGPVVAYSPVMPAAPSFYPAPVTAYRPVYMAPQPVVAYRPVVTAYAGPMAFPGAVVAPRPVVVRTKVYVPGQPIRNVLRAITP